MSSQLLPFLAREWRFVLFGLALTFWSAPGQTFFISLFADHIRADFGLSHGEFGILYGAATLGSALLILHIGTWVDRMRLAQIATLCVITLAIATLWMGLMPAQSGPAALLATILVLRLAGQGMLPHIAATAMARHYRTERGRALAISGFGMPIAESIWPFAIFAGLALVTWQGVWLIVAGLLIATMLPMIAMSSATRTAEDRIVAPNTSPLCKNNPSQRHWTRREMLGDYRFWLLLSLVLAAPFTNTALFFHQLYWAEIKNFTAANWTSGYPPYAVASVAASLCTGLLIDRFSACKLAPLVNLPMVGALILLGWADNDLIGLWGYFTLLGMSVGAAAPVITALWAELYGTHHLGAIRALAQSALVFASAISPMLIGLMIDAGFGFPALIAAMAVLPVASIPLSLVALRGSR